MDAATSLTSVADIAVGQSTLGSLNGVRASGAALDKTANDFEGMFMSQMLQPMFDGIGSDPVFGGGHGEEMMKSFLVQAYGKILANSNLAGGKTGMTAAVKNEMIMAQEKAIHGRRKSGVATEVSATGDTGSNGETHATIQ